jgi:hypothetical protein
VCVYLYQQLHLQSCGDLQSLPFPGGSQPRWLAASTLCLASKDTPALELSTHPPCLPRCRMCAVGRPTMQPDSSIGRAT